MTATEMVDEVEGGEAEVVDEAAEEVVEEEEVDSTIMIGGSQVTKILIKPTNPRHQVPLALTQVQLPQIMLDVQTRAAVI